jgi:U4/U6.U5 tri-snRNP-associated protein 1
LKGSTLGAAEEEEDDAVAWIKKSKKKQKAIKKELELAKQREEEQKEQELAAVYGAGECFPRRRPSRKESELIEISFTDQLRGLKVAHDTKDIDAGSEMILTLKDSRILGDDEDELQNVDLADEERRRAANIRKKRAKEGYTGYDDDEFDPDGGNELPGTRDVLSKYDDEYAGEGLKREGFRLGATPPPEAKRQKRENGPGLGMGIIDDDDLPQDMSSRVNRELLNLDYASKLSFSIAGSFG